MAKNLPFMLFTFECCLYTESLDGRANKCMHKDCDRYGHYSSFRTVTFLKALKLVHKSATTYCVSLQCGDHKNRQYRTRNVENLFIPFMRLCKKDSENIINTILIF